VVFGFLGMQLSARAQADNLMIVKYVDWNSGSGVGIVIWNPTPNPVNLSNYQFRIFGNGATLAAGPTTTSNLSGILQPCATILVGNDSYVNTNCRNTASINNFAPFTFGVNGNDIVVLTSTVNSNPSPTDPFQVVDAIGRIGYDAGNDNSQKVDNVNDALFKKRLERAPGNLARYSLTTGTYNPNVTNGPNIWPNNRTTNVVGWTVSSPVCLTNTWSAPTATVNAGPDITLPCRSLAPITISGANAGGSNVAVEWSGGKGTFSNPNALNTTYTPSPQDFTSIKLTLRATSGCRQVTDQIIILNGDSTQKAAGLTFTPQNPKVGDTVTFRLQPASPATVLTGDFNFGDGTPNQVSIMIAKHVYRAKGTYDVKVGVKTAANCPLDSVFARVVVAEEPAPVAVKIPNIFTPNNDGHNDTFRPQLPATTAYELQVFNRWGVRVFESKQRDKEWDGKNVSDGVYHVRLKVTYATGETAAYKLPVTIVR
jgi:gliding motility-associated-like protein